MMIFVFYIVWKNLLIFNRVFHFLFIIYNSKFMIMLILDFIWKFIKKIVKSKWFWFILLGLFILFFFWKNRQNKLEVERLQNNNTILNQSFKKLKTKNGELYYSLNALTLKKDEFAMSNKNLNLMLKDMNIKLKNVQSITQMDINYTGKFEKIESYPIIITDTIYVPTVEDSITIKNNLVHYLSKYSFTQSSEESSMSGIINIPTSYNNDKKLYLLNKTINPYISDLEFKVTDTLTVVPTINYKRVWLFFRRPNTVTVYIKSQNKLFNLEQVKTYQIVK